MTQEALKLALEVNESMKDVLKQVNELIAENKALKEALAQEQEPVAVVDVHEFYDNCANFSLLQKLPKGKHTLYTTPPQRTWVGLEGEEIRNLWEEATKPDRSTMTMVTSFAKSIEAKLKQKNGYAEEKNT